MICNLHFNLEFLIGVVCQAPTLEQEHNIVTIHKLIHPTVCNFVNQQDIVFGINKIGYENRVRSNKDGNGQFMEQSRGKFNT